jgi:uncharacterized protein YukE
MPDWQPNWEDVRWDYAAADNAARDLRRAADLIDHSTQERAGIAGEATAKWLGRRRREFDEHYRQLSRRAADLAAEYRRSAADIERRSREAYLEQKRRELARMRWHMEKTAEELLKKLNHNT